MSPRPEQFASSKNGSFARSIWKKGVAVSGLWSPAQVIARPVCSEGIIFGNLCARPGVNCEYVIRPKNRLGTQVSIIGVCRDVVEMRRLFVYVDLSTHFLRLGTDHRVF